MPGSDKSRDYLVDTSIFIHWFRGNKKAHSFFRSPPHAGKIFYSKITRKELLRPPIRDSERHAITKFLSRFRRINPDPLIAKNYSELLSDYPYLKDHLADTLIAATALTKGLVLVTTNKRHFLPIKTLVIQDFLALAEN